MANPPKMNTAAGACKAPKTIALTTTATAVLLPDGGNTRSKALSKNSRQRISSLNERVALASSAAPDGRRVQHLRERFRQETLDQHDSTDQSEPAENSASERPSALPSNTYWPPTCPKGAEQGSRILVAHPCQVRARPGRTCHR